MRHEQARRSAMFRRERLAGMAQRNHRLPSMRSAVGTFVE
jgi:hypothetical protein